MKYYFLMLFIILSLGCKKDPEPLKPPVENLYNSFEHAQYAPGDTTNGVFYAIQNQRFWIASTHTQSQGWHQTHPNDYFSIIIRTYSVDSLIRESLYFSEIKKAAIGSYKISKGHHDLDDGLIGSSYFTVISDGDVPEDYYKPDETARNNRLSITLADTLNNYYEGYFSATFIIATPGGKNNPNNPDHMYFSHGQFRVKLEE